MIFCMAAVGISTRRMEPLALATRQGSALPHAEHAQHGCVLCHCDSALPTSFKAILNPTFLPC